MTRSRCTGLLWLALVLCAPIPFFLVERGREPVAALTAMLGAVLALIISEGAAGAVGLAAWMLGAQILAGTLVLAAVAILTTRLLDRVAGGARDAVIGILVVALVSIALTQPIYRTPFRTGGLHATLAQVFE